MNKLNNKGQSLVMFILMLPILLLIMILVIDIGNLFVNKQELDNVNYLSIEYGLDNIDDYNIESKIIDMINLNINDLSKIEVKLENNKIIINTEKKVKGILNKGFNIFNITSNYQGYIENDRKIIERA